MTKEQFNKDVSHALTKALCGFVALVVLKCRRDFIKSVVKASRCVEDAYILFSVMDQILAVDNEALILPENKDRVNAELVAIQKHLDEIKITMAEDKHGRIRR